MNISITAPIEQAYTHTKRVLFEPFDLGKWFALGFCAWLANLGEGGGGGFSGSFPNEDMPRDVVREIENNWDTIILGGIALVLVSAVLILIFSWLRARGSFMFLDGIVHNRSEVKRPWQEFGPRANRLFVANATLGIGGLLLVLAPICLGFMIAWGDIRNEEFEAAAKLGMLIAIIGAIVPGIVIGLLAWVLRNLVTPTMYLHDVSVMEAWKRVNSGVIKDNLGSLALFLLMRIAIAIAAACIAVAAVCLTCCLVAVPYLGTVFLLPLFVFERSYSLYFLEQFGPDWRFFPAPEGLAEPVASDL